MIRSFFSNKQIIKNFSQRTMRKTSHISLMLLLLMRITHIEVSLSELTK